MTTKNTNPVTIYYSENEWIHLLMFNGICENGDTDITSARSELMPYSREQMDYLMARAHADPNIRIFKVEQAF
jgi:hypothetical protein